MQAARNVALSLFCLTYRRKTIRRLVFVLTWTNRRNLLLAQVVDVWMRRGRHGHTQTTRVSNYRLGTTAAVTLARQRPDVELEPLPPSGRVSNGCNLVTSRDTAGILPVLANPYITVEVALTQRKVYLVPTPLRLTPMLPVSSFAGVWAFWAASCASFRQNARIAL